ncbi:unnamed protein product [Medioppia subpectinata]|uniref:Serine carboxypeptidase n=1 Tax=Medioppia subpectinata TaxID=1979941 RepID=A0A7R9KGK1_9ACAR|nr:unnamed protein product [Medioppia subpectinata]CAG2101950.1 unnamed protein product [Medioppia subpectinata]
MICLHSLTVCPKLANKTSEAKSLSAVKGLPNAPTVESYTGFITVNDKYDSNIFFWFIPAFKTPKTAPVVVWLEGGPGISSLFSLFTFGPLSVDPALNVTKRDNSWAEEVSVLYVDNPVGAGYSFTKNKLGYSRDENNVADNLYEFLQQFYIVFDDYRANELYIAGQSYGGKYVPALGYRLMVSAGVSRLNFRGIAVGNGLIDPIHQMNYANVFKTMGLMDELEAQEVHRRETAIRTAITAKDYLKALQLYSDLMVSTPELVGYATTTTGYAQFYDLYQSGPLYKSIVNTIKYLSKTQTRSAIHVGPLEYNFSNKTTGDYLHNDFMQSIEPNLTAIIDGKYKVLLFTGNFDLTVGVDSINGLLEWKDWKYYKDYSLGKRFIWKVSPNDTQIAGYAKGFGNFNHVIVRDAGHCAQCDQPKATLDMITRFIGSKPFGL